MLIKGTDKKAMEAAKLVMKGANSKAIFKTAEVAEHANVAKPEPKKPGRKPKAE